MSSISISLEVASGVISGTLLGFLGLWLLLHRGLDSAMRILALFATSWGLTVVLANVAAGGWSPALSIAHAASILLVPPLLAAFVANELGDNARWTRVTYVSLGASALGAVLLALYPDLYIDAPDVTNARVLRPATANLGLLFGQAPLYLICGAGMLRLLRHKPPDLHAARRSLLVAAGLCCFLAAAAPWFGLRILADVDGYIAARGAVEFSLVVGLLGISAGFLAAACVHLVREKLPAADRRVLGLALLAPLTTSVLAALALLLAGARTNPVGFWRIVMVGLIVLAIMRHRLVESELRFKRTAIATLTAFAALGAALLAEGLVRLAGVSAVSDPSAALVVGAVFAAGVAVPYLPASRRLARRAFRALVEPHDPSRAQQLEVYRAALEARVAADRPVAREDPELARLRQDLAVEPREHDLLLLFIERRRAARAPAFAPGDRILDGTLTVEREIGSGGSARVYEARDAAGRAVAVKAHPPLLTGSGWAGARAVQEAEVLDTLRSANVLPVVEVADRPEAFYVVTERAAGTLADRLAAAPDGRLAPAEALRIARGVLKGLAAVHKAGIVHCDVKPANVLLAPDGRALLADFDAATTREEAGRARGTPAWMAPEQFGEAAASPAADVHAVGALLFRMLAGRHYLRVEGLDREGMRVLVERAVPALDPSWPADVRAFLARCLAKDPAERFRDAGEALAACPEGWPIP